MIYLDYQATTPVAAEVAAAMRPWIEMNFGNPHSSHRIGREAAAAVEVARGEVDALLGLEGGRVYFTSGATEAANWALKGAAARLPPGKSKIITLATEHACVLDTVRWLSTQDVDVDIMPVNPDGLVDLGLLASRIDDRTGLVAVMLVNNEIGVIQPVARIAEIVRAHGALLFCDSVQGVGRVTIPADSCDMVAVSAHKLHGPKGIGALWIRDGVTLEAFLHGGGQEGGLRSGTLSPALCVGFGVAAKLAVENRDRDHAHVERLWNAAWSTLATEWQLNGSSDERYHGNLNIRAEGIDSARLISNVRDVSFSSGSACASGSGRASHVLSALALNEREARSSIRLGFGRYTREEDLIAALTLIQDSATRQRSFAA